MQCGSNRNATLHTLFEDHQVQQDQLPVALLSRAMGSFGSAAHLKDCMQASVIINAT